MNAQSNTNTITGLTQIQQLQLQIEHQINGLSLQSINSNNPSYNADLDLRATDSVLVPNPDESNPNQAATIQYVLDHQGGGGSELPLNEINIAHPLTNNLDFSSSQYTVRSHDPIAQNDVAIKSWVEDQISHYTPTAIEALGDPTSRTNMAQNGRFTYIQGVMKESVMNGLTTEYQPMRYDQNYQIIDPNQLVTYQQTVVSIDEERKERIAADTQLQQNIDDLRNTPLNQWPTPMTPGILMNNFEMNGNNISGLAIQPQNGTPDNYAARVSFVNEAVNNLGFTLGGQISNVKVQCESYTDISVNNLSEQTQIDLATKQNIVPLNEIEKPIAYLDMNGHRITNLAIPAVFDGDLDAVPKGYADSRYYLNTTPLNSIVQPDNALNMNNQRIIGASDAINPTDVPTYQQLLNNQGISLDYANSHYLGINTPLDQVQPPISVLSMNNQNIIDLPLVPLGLNNACSVQYASGLANTAVQNPISDIDLSNTHKIKNCVNPVDQQDVVTLNYFENNLPTSSSNQITNGSYSSVTVDPDQSTTFVNNSDIVLQVNPTNLVVNQPIFSTTQPAADPSNQLLTKQQLDPYYLSATTALNDINAPSADLNMNSQRIQNLADPLQAQDAVTLTYLENNPVYFDTNQIVNNGKLSYVLVNDDQQIIFQNNNAESMHITPTLIVTNQPIFSTVGAPADTTNAILTRSQLDPYYYSSQTHLNDILYPEGNVTMNGFQLRDVQDPTESHMAATKGYVDSNIRPANKINSTSNHAIVECENGSDNVSIKANNAATNLVITAANNTQYKVSNSGDIAIDTQGNRINLNQAAIEIVGSNQSANINILGQIISYAPDSGSGNQVLNRTQNDSRYLTSTTNLSSIPPPTSSVDFSGQLLRNLQTPTQSLDATNKNYVDSALSNYTTTGDLQASYLTKNDASLTYQTSSQVENQINTALVPYSTSTQVDSKISTALVPYSTTNQMNTAISNSLVPYITSSTASNTYQRQDTPFTSIVNNSINSVEAQTNNSGIKIYGGLSNVKTNILDIFAPAGQASGTCEIQGKSRLNIVSNLGLTSIMSGVGQNNSTVTIKSTGDVANQIQYDNLVIGSRSNCPSLQLSSGHDATGNGYSLINNAVSVAANTLQLSPEISANIIAGNNLLMFANSVPVSIKNQFNKNVGLTFTQSSPQSNEFITKSYADATYTGGGIQNQIQDSTQVNKVACSSSNVQIYTPLITGSPSLIFKQSSAFSTYLEMNPSNVTGGLYISYPNIILQVAPTCFTDQTSAGNTQLIQKQYADNRYYLNTTTLDSITAPTANVSLNSNLITNLASGTIASGNTSSVNGNDVYSYIATLPSVITQQVYTVTIFGSTTNGFLFSSLPNTPQNNVVQTQRVKGSGAQMITSSTIIAQSQTLVDSFASLQFQVANANVRITQVVPYTTTTFSTPGQQNIASLTFSQQAINATNTCIQLYKPVSNQGSAAFILYVYVDQF